MRRTLEQKLAALRTLDLADDRALVELREALRSPIGFLVAAAAKLVTEHHVAALAGELAPAFERLCEEAVKRDPGCRGKIAIVHALYSLDIWEERVFVAGLRHVQLEGYDPEDTAAELRGLCGLAHVQFARDDALDVLAMLLADPERNARIAAARGLGDARRTDATALLRYKLLLGEDDPEVLAACIESLLSLAPDTSYDFVVGLLAEHDECAEVAAVALGGARIAKAFEPLAEWCMGCKPEQRHAFGYLAIALLRCDAGNAYLLDAVRSHAKPAALAAARALLTFRDDPSVVELIHQAANERKDAAVRREIEALLDA